jgi:transglutaminase-like putative cysteine protease
MKYLLHSVCFFFLFSLQVLSQDADYSNGILDRATVTATSSLATPEIYPDADEVLLDDYMLISYKADGTFTVWDDEFVKVLTEKGKRENLALNLHFNAAYEKIEVKLLAIIKKDGAVIPVDVSKQSRVMIDNSQMGANIYDPNNKILSVNIPGLEIGDIIRCVSYSDNFKTRVPNTWSAEFPLEGTSPIKQLTVEISAPKELPLDNIRLRAEIKNTVTLVQGEKDGKLRYKWEIKDVPRMFPEPEMPALNSVVQRLLLSTISDWKSLSKWYWELCRPHIEATSPEMEKQVADIVADAKDRQDKIDKLFKFVSQKIRYLGITTETEAPGYEPHDVKTTFENKYGVCRDKAALLAAMLRIAGFKAYPVIILVGPRKDNEVPTPSFNHAITAVENDDGSYMLMDSTNENTKDIFPAYLCNRSYLVAKPEGDILRTSQIIPAEKNLMKIRTQSVLNENGTLSAETTFDFNGINDSAYRGSFAGKKPDEVKRYFEGLIKNAVPGAKLVDLTVRPANMQDTTEPLMISLKYTGENVLIEGNGKIMPPLPWFGKLIGIVNFVLGKAELEKRKYPFDTEIACGTDEEFSMTMNIPEWKAVSIPKYAKQDTETIFWEQCLDFKNGILNGRNRFLLKTVEFSPVQYLELKGMLKEIEFDCRKKPVFRTDSATSAGEKESYGPDVNVAVIKDDVEYEIHDEHSWKTTKTVKKKIITYAGKKSNSELKLNFNPVWDKVCLEYATVTSKDGAIQKITDKEINMMDQPWTGSAPRYPAGKTLVANLPGVDIGSTIEYKIVSENRDRPFFYAAEYFQGFDPLAEKNVILTNPNKVKLELSGDYLKFIVENKEDTIKLKATDSPAIKGENNLPPAWCFIPNLRASSGQNWKDYSSEVKNTLEKAAAGQDKSVELSEKITYGIKNDVERIKALRDYVSKNIKAAGPNFNELPLTCISPADKTLSDGYGNTADIAVVLYAMLDKLNYRPGFILASDLQANPKISQDMINHPATGVFNTVLVRIVLKEGTIYLNDTNQYAEIGSTTHEGKCGLDLDKAAGIIIYAEKSKNTRSEVTYRIELSETGQARIRKHREYFGNEFTANKMKFAEMTPEMRKRYHQGLVSAISQSAKPEGELSTKFDSYPGSEDFSVTVDKYAVQDGNLLYLMLPESLNGILPVASEKRVNPFFYSGTVNVKKEFTIVLPEKYYSECSILPPGLCIDIPYVESGKIETASSTSVITDAHSGKDRHFVIKQQIDLKPFIYTNHQYEDFLLKINERITNPSMRSILIETK